MLPNPLFSQSHSHSHNQSQSQRRRLLLQVPPSCCPDQNVPIWAHKHAVQNVLQPKNKKQTRCERFARTAAAAEEFYLAFLAFFFGFFNVLFHSWVSACCQLRCGTWIYFGCAQFLRISLDIETFERVLCNYSISWRCKQPNSSAYLALIADGSDLKLILHIHISFIWAHWTEAPSTPRSQRMHFQNQSQVKDATAEETQDG